MNQFFIQFCIMGMQASVAILAVLVLRVLFAKMGIAKKYTMLLWIVPFLLLICPWKISFPVGFFQTAPSDYNEQYTKEMLERWVENQSDSIPQTAPEVPNIKEMEIWVKEERTESMPQIVRNIVRLATLIWLTGAATFLGYAFVSYWILKKKVSCCIQMEDGSYCVDGLWAPMVLGILKPRIYLPSGMEKKYRFYVLEHERTHILRKDPIFKLAAYGVVCMHWFHPLVWVAYVFMEKDMEMACDEETIGRIGMEQKKEYATALLQLSNGTYQMFVIPLGFSEGNTKGRIRNMLHYKKTVKLAAMFAVAVSVLVFVIFLTKQKHFGEKEQLLVNALQTESGNALQNTLEGTDIWESEKNEARQNLTFELVRQAEADHTLHELDFHSFANGEELYFDGDQYALNYDINFYFEYEGENYILETSHWLENDELDDVYIRRESDAEMRWLYRNEDGENRYSGYLEVLLNTKEDVNNWLTIELPEGYVLGTYWAGLGIDGGALISPQAYELYESELSAPPEWYYAGFIGKISSGLECFIFENGRLTDGEIGFWNHSGFEKLEVLDLNRQALLVQFNHDLYTAAGLGALEEQGTDLESIAVTSDYWYFFFVEEGEDIVYYLTLSSNLFTKEEAIAIAETVMFLQ